MFVALKSRIESLIASLMKIVCLLLVSLIMRLPAQRPDLDEFSREVDLSTLKPIESAPESGEAVPLPPPNHLFAGIDVLDPLPEAGEDTVKPLGENGLRILHLPAAEYLVVPNPPRIDGAYQRLAETLEEMGYPAVFPLKVVLHADSKFSVAIALRKERTDILPIGVDISPLPSITLLGVDADIHLLQKDHPPVLEAYLAVRKYARSARLELDTTEFYALPGEDERVFFALRIKKASRTGDLPVQP